MNTDIQPIAWHTLTHAGGTAADVPESLSGLQSSNPILRIQALDTLYQTIYVEGQVYSASVPAVNYLIAIAVDSEVGDRDRVIGLLIHLATAASAPAEFGLGEAGLAAPQDPALEPAARQDWAVKCRAAVQKRLFELSYLIEDPSAEVRMAVPQLLACFYNESAQLLPKLLRALGREKEHGVVASLVLALGVLGQRNARLLECFDQLTDPARPALVRLAALMALARSQRGGTADKHLTDLIELMTDTGSLLQAEYVLLPWSDSDLLGDCSLVLCYFGRRRAALVIPDLLWALERADDHGVLNVAYALLYFSFGASMRGPSQHTLSDLQCTVLVAIAESQALWQRQTEIRELLRLFELPEWPDLIEDFLDSGIEHKS